MNRRRFLKASLAATGVAASMADAVASAAEKLVESIKPQTGPIVPVPNPAAQKPNILLVLADDLGIDSIGCYGADAPFKTATPDIDRLAAGGIRFSRCYNNALCTPTRLVLMTGQYNCRNYSTFGEYDLSRGPFFASILRDAGYATAVAGKWQLSKAAPADAGFDTHQLWNIKGADRPRYWSGGRVRDGKTIDTTGKYAPDLDVDFLIDFMKAKRDRPFFAYYPSVLTHGPLEPTPDAPEKGKGKKGDGLVDSTAYLDKQVGRLVAALDDLKLREKTLVIFLEDNGAEPAIPTFRGKPSLSPGKAHLTERGMLSATVANWPGFIAPGTVNDDLVAFYDFFPTFLELAGVPLPKRHPCDGVSIVPQLHGKPGQTRDWLMLECGCQRAVLDKQFKLNEKGQLFDIRNGPNEEPEIPRDTALPEAKAARAKLEKAAAGLPPVRTDLDPMARKLGQRANATEGAE